MTSTEHNFPTWGTPPAHDTDAPTWAHRIGPWDIDVDGSADRTIDGAPQILHTFDPSDHGEITVQATRYQQRDDDGRIVKTEDTVQITQGWHCINLAPAAARHLAAMLECSAQEINRG